MCVVSCVAGMEMCVGRCVAGMEMCVEATLIPCCMQCAAAGASMLCVLSCCVYCHAAAALKPSTHFPESDTTTTAAAASTLSCSRSFISSGLPCLKMMREPRRRSSGTCLLYTGFVCVLFVCVCVVENGKVHSIVLEEGFDNQHTRLHSVHAFTQC